MIYLLGRNIFNTFTIGALLLVKTIIQISTSITVMNIVFKSEFIILNEVTTAIIDFNIGIIVAKILTNKNLKKIIYIIIFFCIFL